MRVMATIGIAAALSLAGAALAVDFSPWATAQKIDMEVRRIIEEAYTRAERILTERIHELHALAKGLLEYETLTGDEIKALLRGERPVRTPYEEPEPTPQTRPPATVPSSGRSRGEPSGGFISPEPQPGT